MMNNEHSTSIATYTIIFVVLMVLLGVTVGAAFVQLHSFNIIVAMAIATVKAWLVLWYFMHLKHAPKLVHVFMMSSVLMMFVGFVLLFCDYFTRA